MLTTLMPQKHRGCGGTPKEVSEKPLGGWLQIHALLKPCSGLNAHGWFRLFSFLDRGNSFPSSHPPSLLYHIYSLGDLTQS